MAGKPLLPLGLRCRPGSPLIQYLAIRAHDQQKGGVETGAALFVSGLPPILASEEAVRELFSCFGAVAQAVLHPSKVRLPHARRPAHAQEHMKRCMTRDGCPCNPPPTRCYPHGATCRARHRHGLTIGRACGIRTRGTSTPCPVPSAAHAQSAISGAAASSSPCLQRSGMVVFESQAGRLAALRHAAKGQVVEFDPSEAQDDEPIGVKGVAPARVVAAGGSAVVVGGTPLGDAAEAGPLAGDTARYRGRQSHKAKQGCGMARCCPDPPLTHHHSPPPLLCVRLTAAAWVHQHKALRPGNDVLQEQVGGGGAAATPAQRRHGAPACMHLCAPSLRHALLGC